MKRITVSNRQMSVKVENKLKYSQRAVHAYIYDRQRHSQGFYGFARVPGAYTE